MSRKTINDLKEGGALWSGADGARFGREQAEIADKSETRARVDGQARFTHNRHSKSWVVIGIDTSMSVIAMTGVGYDDTLKKMTKVRVTDLRWKPEDDDYLKRLGDACKAHQMAIDVMPIGIPLDRCFIFQEEPVPLGMMNSGKIKFESGWIKQQCEISGAVLGSLVRWGFPNIWQINNQQWKKVLRKEGVTIRAMPEGKWDVKEWAIQAYGMPDLVDLVKSKTGGKIPRPKSGYGAKAKPVQPDDIYDAAACMAYGCDFIQDQVNSPQ